MAASNANLVLAQITDGIGAAGALGRGLAAFAGIVLCLASLGLWLEPDAFRDPDSLPVRTALTFFFTGLGYCLFRLGRPGRPEVFELDLQAGLLQHVQQRPDGRVKVLNTLPLSELNSLKAKDNWLTATTRNGVEILRVPVDRAMPQAAIDRVLGGHATVTG